MIWLLAALLPHLIKASYLNSVALKFAETPENCEPFTTESFLILICPSELTVFETGTFLIKYQAQMRALAVRECELGLCITLDDKTGIFINLLTSTQTSTRIGYSNLVDFYIGTEVQVYQDTSSKCVINNVSRRDCKHFAVINNKTVLVVTPGLLISFGDAVYDSLHPLNCAS
jgi:hypothetical protein